MKSGGEIAFEKLILATGARPRKLNIPGVNLGTLFYLRSLEDSAAIRRSADALKRAVVIGSGFIAMEVASVLRQKGLEVTMVLNEDRIWKRFFSPPMSAFFEDYYSARGVRFVKNATLTELRGHGAVSSAVLADGRSVPCDMAVAGIGVQPSTEMLASSGIEVNNGVMVDEFLKTSQPDVYAAGDVANYQDLLFGKRRRVEHWDNAVSQGQYCARALMGERTPFKHVPYFFSDVFDLSYCKNTGGMPAPQIKSFTVVRSLARVSACGGFGNDVWLQHSRWVVRTKNANLCRGGSKRSGPYQPKSWNVSRGISNALE